MNKKVLTLCAGFLLAGGLVNFASAEDVTIGDLSQKVGYLAGNGDYFFFVNSDRAYGFEEQKDGSIVEKSTPLNWNIDEEAVDNYLWKVDSVALDGETQKVWAYSLVNKATGKQLIFKKGTENQIGWVNLAADAKVTGPYDKTGYFLFHDKGTYNATVAAGKTTAIYDGQQNDGMNNWKAMHLGNGTTSNGLYRTTTASTSISADYAFYFCKYVEQEMGDNLNDLYNSIGFNLVLESKYKDVENVFAQEGERITAVAVTTNDVKSDDATTASFPQGTYFVVNNKQGAAPTSGKALYDFLMNSTLIVASPSVNDINDKDWIKAGEGFQLTKKQGRDLVKVGTDKVLAGEDVSVNNACFKVQKDVNGKFALTLPEFWYNDTKDAEKQVKKAVSINVVDKDGDDNDDVYLVTDADAWNYIFSYDEVNTVPYTKFLKQNSKAVYNITFADGDLAGKYLFAPAYEAEAYAKGAKFVNPNDPETQYIVTDVDLEDNNITFESRANKAYSFTAKFYEEADGVYSIAIKGGAKQAEFTDLNVNAKGDIVATADQDLHTQWVRLTPVAVDKFAGAWDVDNLTEVTMSFARDDESTSNRLFVKINDEYGNISVSDEQTDAIQFRLVKDEEPSYITNEYAYLDANNKVKKYADGDTIAYYTYQLQAYRDGEAIDKYLAWETTYNNRYYLADDGNQFIIKDNVTDGSTIILYAEPGYGYNHNTNIVVEDYDNTELSISDYENHVICQANLTEAINANYVKTFLKVETPETTLNPKSTYVTMSTELDNYVAIKDDRDGIITGKETTLRLFATDTDRQIPSFLVATGYDNATGKRLFLFNAVDSVNYNVATGDFNKEYALNGDHRLNKAIFRPGTLNEANAENDTIYTTIKGKVTAVTNQADNNKNAQAGLNRYKFQIIEDIDNEGYYLVRQEGFYLFNVNEFLVFAQDDQYNRTNALRVKVEATDMPTANESINAADEAVKVVATNGAVIVKGAEGKNVVVSTILGKVVANEVLNSDNETIAAPAGIVVVSVDGESFKVAVK